MARSFLIPILLILNVLNVKGLSEMVEGSIFSFEIICRNGDHLQFSTNPEGTQKMTIKNKGSRLLDNAQLELQWKYNQQTDAIGNRSMKVIAKLFDSETPVIKDVSEQLDGLCRTCVEGNKLLALIKEEIPSLFEVGLAIVLEGLTINKPEYREMIPVRLRTIIPKAPEIVQKLQYRSLLPFKDEMAEFFAKLPKSIMDTREGGGMERLGEVKYPPQSLPSNPFIFLLASLGNNFYIPWEADKERKVINEDVIVRFQKEVDGIYGSCQLTFGENGITVSIRNISQNMADLIRRQSPISDISE